MSSTRYAPEDAPPRQDRYASSAALERGLLANLVAIRCRTVRDPDARARIWFAQFRSWQPGGLASLPLPPDEITRLCLDPATDPAPLAALDPERSLAGQASSGGAETEIVRRINDALDYARAARCLALVDGPARIGKSFAVRAWCARTAGLARYVETPSSNDDGAFFRAIATALGVSSGLSYKAVQIRDRVEEVVQGGDLMLVFDEAHYFWPQSNWRFAAPARVNWLSTAVVNHGVASALVTTPQFYSSQRQFERMNGWAAEQFLGRIGHLERLPERVRIEDLVAVARTFLPECDKAIWQALAAYAHISRKHLSSIEAIAKRSRWLAVQDGRATVTIEDVRRALAESVIPTDGALEELIGVRKAGSSVPPLAATHLQSPRMATTDSIQVVRRLLNPRSA